jgi:protein-L-isoaspartate O-methyltransferase
VHGARAHLAAAGIEGVEVVCADGGLGHPAAGPYDRIVLTVGAWDIAPAWWDQLAPGGRLLVPPFPARHPTLRRPREPRRLAGERVGARLRLHAPTRRFSRARDRR